MAEHDDHLIIDAMNVIGSRPTGWWRDRDGAVRDFVARLSPFADRHGSVIVVVDGRPLPDLPEGSHGSVAVCYARRGGPNAADDRIVELVEQLDGRLRVVTADRDLRQRVKALGATTGSPRQLLAELDAA